MSDANQAVFLSYASQDAAAVQRIAEALRAAGVEVWFDQNELVGGDAWDAKIRGQIASCALFVPVVSANTNARGEGYFRLEWKLAVDRSHLMAHDQPFLLPVVIDDTSDAAARVPPEFRAVQWTRLPGGETPEKFCVRVKQLLESGVVEAVAGGSRREGTPGGAAAARVRGGRSARAAWIASGVLVAALAIGGGIWLRPRAEAEATSREPGTTERAKPLTEAQQLVVKARQILDEGDELNRETYVLAEELLKKAEALDVTEGSAWGLHVRLSTYLHVMGLDRSPARLEAMQSHADRAMKLVPDSVEAQTASAQAQMVIRQDLGGAQQRLRALAVKHPGDARILRELAWLYRYDDKLDEALAVLARAREIAPADQGLACDVVNCLILSGRFAEADALVAQAMTAQPVARMLAFDVWLKLYWNGNLAGVPASLQRWPAWFLREDRGAGLAAMAWQWKGEPDKALEALQKLPRDYVRDYWFTGPRAVLSAWAHERAGHAEAARADWQIVVRLADRELASAPDDPAALHWKAWALARLGDTAAADRLSRLLEERRVARGSIEGLPQLVGGLTGLALMLGQTDRAIELLTRMCAAPVSETRGLNRVALSNNPHFEPLRRDPRFQALVAAAPAPVEKAATPPNTAAPAVTAPAPNDKSLVVLPLENLSPDPENAFFTDGMHAEIISTLQRMSDLKVIARDSAMTFKSSTASLAEKAQRVAAAHVITGSVRRAGTQVRVQLELRRARDEALLWTQTYDKELGQGVIAIQSDIADQVARLFQARARSGTYAGAQFMTANAEAYDAFLKASQILYADRTPTGHRKAVAGLERALALDPGFSSAAQLLAAAKVTAFRAARDPGERLRHGHDAKRWAEEARRLLPGGAGDAALAGYYSQIEPDNARSLALIENAVNSLPNDGAIRNMMAVVLSRAGRAAESVEVSRRAIALDPLNQVYRGNLVFALSRLRRMSEFAAAEPDYVAVADPATSRRALDDHHWRLTGSLPPTVASYRGVELADWLVRAQRDTEALPLIDAELSAATGSEVERWQNWIRKCDVLRRLQREPEALAAAQAAQASLAKINAEPEFDASERDLRVAVTLARLGRADDAITAGRRYVSARSAENQVSARWQRDTELAEIYAYLRRPRECCELLTQLLRVPSGITVPMLKADPIWNNVRDDPAFRALLADPKNSAPL